MKTRARTASFAASFTCAAVISTPAAVRAAGSDVGPPTVSVTETSIVAQHFDARDNEQPQDSGWGEWMNRLDAAIRQGRWAAGLRLDSALYWRRPDERNDSTPTVSAGEIERDGESRFQNSIYPAKLWVTYSAPGVEVTAGDAYVQFGRGLTLSMRKIDELGIDTTVRGGKIQIERDPFAFTLVAGIANPARVDEASGRTLFPTVASSIDPKSAVFGSDRLVGVEIMTGRGLPVTLSTHAVRFSRCAPYAFDANAIPKTDFFQSPGGVTFGSCSSEDEALWLSSLPAAPPTLDDKTITMIGQSLEVPNLGGHGKLYLEAAAQSRTPYDSAGITHPPPDATSPITGNALYATLSVDGGPLTTTLEIKSNRNFFPVAAAVDTSHAPEFNVVAYSFVPPAETPTILDTEFGYFNACVNGGRLRADVQASDALLVYGQGIFDSTRSENTTGLCDARGRVVSPGPSAGVTNTVWDGITGFEWTFDGENSHVFASGGVREDSVETGAFYYRERHLEYSIAKNLGGPYAIEIQGFHRVRWEGDKNQSVGSGVPRWWHEGENYVAFKIAPAWVLSQGFEYTSYIGDPTYYFNGAVLYRFTSGSNLRLFVGQQRAAFRCASGICRPFPAFEGARAELTVRF
jgi:hypothetical protein